MQPGVFISNTPNENTDPYWVFKNSISKAYNKENASESISDIFKIGLGGFQTLPKLAQADFRHMSEIGLGGFQTNV